MKSSRDTELWDARYMKIGATPQSPYTAAIHDKVKQIIPDDVTTILDAGCGGGALMEYLAREGKYTIEGVEQSSAGVRYVVDRLNMKATVGDITDMYQFHDKSFDLVICSEVLEHIPIKVLPTAIRELSRVAKKYLIVTTPFIEKLSYHQVICCHCQTRYHPAGHIHSMDH